MLRRRIQYYNACVRRVSIGQRIFEHRDRYDNCGNTAREIALLTATTTKHVFVVYLYGKSNLNVRVRHDKIELDGLDGPVVR